MTSFNEDLTYDTKYSEFVNVEETYSLLFSAFENGLSDNIEDLLNDNIDYLSLILEKINFVTQNTNTKENLEEIYLLNKAKLELYNSIENKLVNIFNINLDSDTIDRKAILATAYRFFFINKKENIINFLCNYILSNKKAYISQYKNLMNKDITYTQIKNEINLENVNYYPLIYFYQDIVTNLIECDIIPISTVFEKSEISLSEFNMLNILFENSNKIEEYSKLFKSLSNSSIYPDFLVAFRNALIEKLLKIS